MSYHITGSISAIIFLLTLAGLWSQLALIWAHKNSSATLGRSATEILSLNQFVSSFMAFFSFFLYSVCLPRFNHYIAWPRLAACLLTLWVLYEIMKDRDEPISIISFWSCLIVLLVAPLTLLLFPGFTATIRVFSQGLIVAITIVLAQGYLHQVVIIRQRGATGSVSIRMHQLFFLKDVSTIVFAFAMRISTGWPFLLLATVSAITKLMTIWHFRWVRESPIARERRGAVAQENR